MKKILSGVLAITLCASVFADSSNSIDGTISVAGRGDMPSGLFGKAAGYLPGDTVSITNPTTGILFNSSGTLEQTVNVNAKTVYFLHFFLKGNVRVKISDNNGRYWIPEGYTGAWGNTEHWTSFASNDWCNRSMFFINDSRVSSVTVTFGYETGHFGFVDYVRLNKKTKASTFLVTYC